jgi:putative transposase
VARVSAARESDPVLNESTVGSFKNELMHWQGRWRDVKHVELATAE